jgi:hypothetical protein
VNPWRMCVVLWAGFTMLAALGAVLAGPPLAVVALWGDGWAWVALPWVMFALPAGIIAFVAAFARLDRWEERDGRHE